MSKYIAVRGVSKRAGGGSEDGKQPAKMEYLASTANEPLRVVTGSIRTVRSETCSRICKLRIELDAINTVEAGTRWKHRESACLGSMDLASGQSRGLLRFLPSKLSPRGVASLVRSRLPRLRLFRFRLGCVVSPLFSPSLSVPLASSSFASSLRLPVLPLFSIGRTARSFS